MDGHVSHVLNVIAADAAPKAEALAELLSSYGEISWLSPGKAFDIAMTDDPVDHTPPPSEAETGPDAEPETAPDAEDEAGEGDDADAPDDLPTEAEIVIDNLTHAVREARKKAEAEGFHADINLVALENRRKKLLVADMDSTIITCECLDEIAGYAGLKEQISAITEEAMRGKLPFAESLRRRVAMLKGVPVSTLESVWRERIYLTGGARELIGTMKANGAKCMLVSGGFMYFASRVAKACGFEHAIANQLIHDGHTLLGTVAEPILDRRAKLATLMVEAERMGLSFDQTMAVGDGANDLAMIKRAGIGVAFHAKPLVAKASKVRINHNHLRALLYLQGYRDSEIHH